MAAATEEHVSPSRRNDLSLCVTLLSLFDFEANGLVNRTEWERGLSTLLLGGLSADDSLWNHLLKLYDPDGKGAVQLSLVRDVLPIDPRITVLFQQLVHSVAGCREYVAKATQRQNREVEMKSQRAVIRLRRRLLEPILNGWRTVIREEKTLKRKAARFMRSQNVARAWRSWLELVDNGQAVAKKKQRMAKIMRRMQNRGVSQALNSWLDAHHERKRLQALARRALGGGVTRAWNQWVGVAEETARLKAIIGRGFKSGLVKAWNSWNAAVDDGRRLRSIGARAFGGGLVRAFNTWVDSLGDMKKMARFLRRCLNRGLAKAWGRWLEMLDERAVLAKFARKALNRGVYKGWLAWIGMLEERERLRAVDERDKQRKLLGRALQGGLMRAFNQWAAVHAERVWMQQKARTVLSGGTGRAFRAWVEMIEEKERQMKLLRRALSGNLLRAWNQWLEVTEEMQRLRALGARVVGAPAASALRRWVEFVEENEKMRRVIARGLNGSVVRAFNAWVDTLGDRKKMARFLRRCLNRGLAKAWGRWLEMLDERAVLAKFGRKMLNRSVMKAWNAWLDLLWELERVKKLARRMLQSGVVKAWNTWEDHVYEMRRLRKFGARIAMRDVSRAFEQWGDATGDQRRKQRFARRWKNAGVGRAFSAWVEMREQGNRVKKLARKVMARMRGDQLELTFDAWAQHVAAEVEHRRALMRRSLNRMRDRLLTIVFESWATVVGSEAERLELMRPFANRLLMRSLTVTYEAWRDHAAKTGSLRRRFAARIANQLLGRVFDAWAEEAERANADAAAKRRVAAEAVMRMQSQALVQVFHAWARYVMEARAAMARALARWESSGAAAALDTWAQYAADRNRFVAIGRKMIARAQNRLLASVFLPWAALVAVERAQKAKSKTRAMAMLSGRAELLMQLSFETWRDDVAATVARRAELASKFYGRYQHQAVAKVFLAWAAAAAAAAEERAALMERAMAFWSGKTELMLAMTFRNFKAAVGNAKAEREALVAAALTRMRNGSLGAAYDAWVAFVEASKAERAAEAQGAPPDPGAETAALLLQTTEELSTAVAELRASSAERDHDSAATAARLQTIESQLSKTTRLLQRNEKLLAPLPSAAVDQAAYALMRDEVARLGDALAATQKQMLSMHASKAARSDLAHVRTAVAGFLFGTAPPDPPPLPPPPAAPAALTELYQPSKLPAEAPLEADGGRGANAPPSTPEPPEQLPTIGQPRPPTAQRTGRMGARPSPRAQRPATARNPRSLCGGVGVTTGGDDPDMLARLRRPTSARTAASSNGSYGDGADAFKQLLGGGGGSGDDGGGTFVEVTELFEEKGQTSRRSAGARAGGAVAARPPTVTRPLSARRGTGLPSV